MDQVRDGVGAGLALVALLSDGSTPPPDYRDLVVRMVHGENLLELLQGGASATKSGKGSKVSPCVQTKLNTVEAEMGRLTQDIKSLMEVREHLGIVLKGLLDESKYFEMKENNIENVMKIIREHSHIIATDVVQSVGIKQEKMAQDKNHSGDID